MSLLKKVIVFTLPLLNSQNIVMIAVIETLSLDHCALHDCQRFCYYRDSIRSVGLARYMSKLGSSKNL